MKNNQYHKTAKGSNFRSSARDMITVSSSAFISPFLAFITSLLPSSNFFSVSRSYTSLFYSASCSYASLFFFSSYFTPHIFFSASCSYAANFFFAASFSSAISFSL